MREYTFTDGVYTVEIVSKATARKAYKNGLRVLLCPVNLRPGYPFHPETSISGKAAATFEEQLNAFTGKKPTAATLETVKQYDYRYIGG